MAAPSISYGSGNNYLADVVSTNLTFQTSNGPLTISNVNIGLITIGSTTTETIPQDFNEALTSSVPNAPIDGSFYGDFGMGLGGDQSIEAILAQLTGGLSNGFIIAVGTAPNGSTGQIGTLQIGLGADDITSFDTLVTMRGQNTLDTFPNSGEPTYKSSVAVASPS
jgi:hypothetical protein